MPPTICHKSKLILQQGEVINGIMPIKIDNGESLCSNHNTDYHLSVSFKFNRTRTGFNWTKAFDSDCFTIHLPARNQFPDFSLKVPLYTFPYVMKYSVQITKETTQTEQQVFESRWNMILIPSLIIDPQFKLNDRVLYLQPFSSEIHDGNVWELHGNNSISIQSRDNTRHIKSIARVHTSKVALYPVNKMFLIDLTNCFRSIALLDTVLRINTKYLVLYNQLTHILADYLMNLWKIEGFDFYWVSIPELLSLYICECLYPPEYDLRVRCTLGDTHLKCDQEWRWRLRHNKRFGCEYMNGVKSINGFICNICNVFTKWNEFVFVCSCDLPESIHDVHVFCLSCVHSQYTERNTMKPLISAFLYDVLDDNCIEEIVAFCFGECRTFDMTQTSTDVDQYDTNDKVCMVDTIGRKRKISPLKQNLCGKKQRTK
eukprot:79541_1